MLYTANGLMRARDLYTEGRNVDAVLDGRFGHAQAAAPASHVFRTGTKQVYRLQTREGYYVRATADHRIMTSRGWVELGQLQPGDSIHILNRKGGFGIGGSLELGRSLGWLVGDGTIKQDRAVLSFFGDEKQELAPLFASMSTASSHPAQLRTAPTMSAWSPSRVATRHVYSRSVCAQSPQSMAWWNRNIACRNRSSRAMPICNVASCKPLITADGSFQDGGPKGASIRLAANSTELLEGVQQLLLNFGIASRIYRNRRDAAYRNLPDAQGGLKEYWCEAQHELAISKQNLGCSPRISASCSKQTTWPA